MKNTNESIWPIAFNCSGATCFDRSFKTRIAKICPVPVNKAISAIFLSIQDWLDNKNIWMGLINIAEQYYSTFFLPAYTTYQQRLIENFRN
jgi:hypothetical protein